MKVYKMAEGDALRASNGQVLEVNATLPEEKQMEESLEKALKNHLSSDGSTLKQVNEHFWILVTFLPCF